MVESSFLLVPVCGSSALRAVCCLAPLQTSADMTAQPSAAGGSVVHLGMPHLGEPHHGPDSDMDGLAVSAALVTAVSATDHSASWMQAHSALSGSTRR